MKKLVFLLAVAAALMCACNNDDDQTWDEYMDWRDKNNAWFESLKAKTNPDGTFYYESVTPSWSPNTPVLIHYFNDRSETEGKLSPLYTSTVDVRYMLHLYDGTPADSSTNVTDYGAPGIFRARLDEMILGWGIALPQMRCGDTAEIVVPYAAAYGTQSLGVIKPFSNLRFNVRLVDIPHYESIPY